ncbi:MAG: SigE family RNA polymerase sigma factor [Nocardioidaceae bacterium]
MRGRDDLDFDEFVVASWPSLFRASVLLMGDYHLAEDVLQSALAKVYAVWPRVSKVEHPRSYTRTVLTNEAMSWWRRKSSKELPVADWSDAAVVGHEDSVTQASVVWQALRRLPPRQRAVIVLRYYEDLSEAEIARTLGISTGSVKSHAHHAIRAMSGHLGPEMQDTSNEGEQP